MVLGQSANPRTSRDPPCLSAFPARHYGSAELRQSRRFRTRSCSSSRTSMAFRPRPHGEFQPDDDGVADPRHRAPHGQDDGCTGAGNGRQLLPLRPALGALFLRRSRCKRRKRSLGLHDSFPNMVLDISTADEKARFASSFFAIAPPTQSNASAEIPRPEPAPVANPMRDLLKEGEAALGAKNDERAKAAFEKVLSDYDRNNGARSLWSRPDCVPGMATRIRPNSISSERPGAPSIRP